MSEYLEVLATRALAAWRETVDPSQSDVELLLRETNPSFQPLEEPLPEIASRAQEQDFQPTEIGNTRAPSSDQQHANPSAHPKKVATVAARLWQWLCSRLKNPKGHSKGTSPEGALGSEEPLPKKPSGAEKRDFWQSEIVRALVPANDQQVADLHAQRKKVAAVAARLCQLLPEEMLRRGRSDRPDLPSRHLITQ